MTERPDTLHPPPVGGLLDETARNELAVRHLDLVGRVVGRLPIAIPKTLDRDDLLSVGNLGLLNAARTFQPGRGAAFRTFAYMAIRAAILDELRRHDPLPRGTRGKLKKLRDLETKFRGDEGRLPLPDEIAAALEISTGDAVLLLAQAETERLLRQESGEVGSGEMFEPLDIGGAEPSDGAERREELELIELAIRDLTERERQVVVLYFSEGLYLKEIGETLGVTESRISQILACAQRKIRVKIEKKRGAAGD